MKPESLIVRRFDELIALGQNIGGARATEQFAEWIAASMTLVDRVFGSGSPYRETFDDAYKTVRSHGVVDSAVQKSMGALKAASDDYRGGLLLRTKTLVRAEISEDVLTQAEELLAAGYKDPACVLAGVTLEISLRDLCERHSVAPGKVDRMNADLAANDVYNKGMQKQISTWAHWRNAAAHGKWDEYTDAQVGDMIVGVRRFVAEYL